jgi:coiled-coil domain-containing protein 12
LAPKKITFDLKRAIEPRLEKLERATDRAIAELIRERLKEEAAQDKHDLLAAVNAGAAAAAHTDDED